MTALSLIELIPLMPEIFVAVMGMLLLLLGVTTSDASPFRTIYRWSLVSLVLTTLILMKIPSTGVSVLNGMFALDGFAVVFKVLICIGAAFSLFMGKGYIEREGIDRFEYPVLVLFSVLGMMMMVSANDLMALYIGLELQSLPLYVLAAIQRDHLKSSEAGLKYFVLGALSSGLLLFGASLVYGFTGATGFDQIAIAAAQSDASSIGLIIGMVFLMAGLAFKISAVPFHMWVPDVYEGAPTAVTAFFAIAPKIAAIALICRLFLDPFGPMVDQWRQVIIVISIASMVVGAVGAIAQKNIKRLLAYSSIGHMGYALVGLAAATSEGVRAIVLYMLVYMVMSIGTFAVVLAMRRRGHMVEGISDLAGLSRTSPLLALSFAILMFSMSGIPPLAGFFGKLFVFQAAIDQQLYALAIIGVVTSVIAAFYYLNVIKVMYFDESIEPLDDTIDTNVSASLAVSVLFVVFFIFFVSPVLSGADASALSLMQK